MANPPTGIRSLSKEQALELTWDNGKVIPLSFLFLRGECPCAACVDEFTGQKILDVSTIPKDIHPTDFSMTGNYALKIVWSDNHDSGLFTWDFLALLCQAVEEYNENK